MPHACIRPSRAHAVASLLRMLDLRTPASNRRPLQHRLIAASSSGFVKRSPQLRTPWTLSTRNRPSRTCCWSHRCLASTWRSSPKP
eukprot:2669091-Lingulodinium_polyedra.AAC.1